MRRVDRGWSNALFLASNLGFLWYNVVGCGLVVAVSLALEVLRGRGAISGSPSPP